MVRKVLFQIFLCGCFLACSHANAQKIYGNEWINHEQTYLRIPIVQSGFYRITGEELEQAGIPLQSVRSASFQMFRRGKELAIEVKQKDSGGLDYIGFYGERNDGALDTALYVKPDDMPHTHYSLYSDTSAYFLTWHGTLAGKRIIESTNTGSEETINENDAETSQLFTSSYPAGNFYPATSTYDNGSVLTTYDVGEGWTGPEVSNGSWSTAILTTENAVAEKMDRAVAELVIVGRSAGNHEIEVWTGTTTAKGRKLGSFKLLNYASGTFRTTLAAEDVNPDGTIKISIVPLQNTGTVSLSYARLRYPQKSVLSGTGPQKEFYFNLPNQAKWNLAAETAWQFYDISDLYTAKEIKPVAGISLQHTARIVAVRQALKIPAPRVVRFGDLRDTKINYLIITHPAVRQKINGTDPVLAYATYRSSEQGGSYLPYIVNSEEVYDRFNYGEPGPGGIRNMIAWLHKNASLQFVFLIGRSIDPQTARKQANARQADMVPNAGWPGSDVALSMNLNGSGTYVPLVPVGRLNAASAEDVRRYLEKVRNLEAQPASAAWRKNILHLSGGRSAAELPVFKEYVNSFERRVQGTSLAAKFRTISKKTDEPVEEFPIYEEVNNGVALLTLFGHSSLNVSDIDIGFASDTKRNYKNNPFYPAVLVNGCALGNIYYSAATISNDWILSPSNGAVLFLAHTHNGLVSALKRYSDSFYDVLADRSFTSQPFGLIQKEAIRRNIARYPGVTDGITSQQMNLQGDPAIRIFPASKPDYVWDSSTLVFSDPSGRALTAWSDSVRVRIAVANNGRFRKEKIRVSVRRTKETVTLFEDQWEMDAMPHADTLSFTIPNKSTTGGDETWIFSIDPSALLDEENKSNNVLTSTLAIKEGGAIPLLPVKDYQTNTLQIDLVAQTTEDKPNGTVIFEWSKNSAFPENEVRRSTVSAKEFIAVHKIDQPGAEAGKYYWRVYMQGDQLRPSETRSITYIPGTDLPVVKTPEVIILPTTLPAAIAQGNIYRATLSFRNITDFGFSDSVSVLITTKNKLVSVEQTLRIAPVEAQETRNIQLEFETLDKEGPQQITLVFNNMRLPETVYANNTLSFGFEVIPDRLPPVVTVMVDGRSILNNEVVSPQPQIRVQIVDENPFMQRSDTTGTEIWLTEDCTGCAARKISLTNASLQVDPENGLLIGLTLPAPLTAGRYKLQVYTSDLSKNQAPVYEIFFRVITSASFAGTVYPNPSAHWFRFTMDITGEIPPEIWTISIWNKLGQLIKNQDIMPHLGKNEWHWQPIKLSSGIYFYKMTLKSKDADYPGYATKGKLIWMP
ncbi:hypothetical protein DYBT9275_00124 [Dyadobacter sp. CECT 9275]|uniref:Gingipain domain-containing protein n=1 Tax=Dyadobacter helix TaxID=2822344 RepID=A0A916NJC4_9BACT|nr:C25 family cysteine peptidase [Dyadobacter sp. CECT 9275]CAG4988623.1 hypothetical protein DYBT9275_00124 [Dyadobacter sp. CECT 9275]